MKNAISGFHILRHFQKTVRITNISNENVFALLWEIFPLLVITDVCKFNKLQLKT